LSRACSGVSPRDAVADGFVEMLLDFGVEFFLALAAAEPVEFHALRSCLADGQPVGREKFKRLRIVLCDRMDS